MAVPEKYRLFKFKNGEDVIAEYVEHPTDKEHVILHRPMQVQVMMALDKNNNPVPAKLIMTEWLAFSQNDTAVVPRDSILCWGNPTELIAGVYENEKRRIDQMRSNADMGTPPPNELDKTPEQIAEEKKAEKRRNKKKNRVIVMQMTLGTLIKFLEMLGLDTNDEPWKSMVNPPDADDEEEDDEEDDEEEDEDKPANLDGRLDIMPDVDGEGYVDPYGNKWDDRAGPPPS